MKFNHLKWEKAGRTFEVTDDLDVVIPNTYAFRSSPGDENILDGNGEYQPYVKDGFQLKFGKSKNVLRLDPDRQTISRLGQVICNKFKFAVQAYIGGEWVTQPHGTPERGFRDGEVFRGEWVEREKKCTGYLTFPDAHLSFGSQNPYDLAIGLEAGGSGDNIHIGVRLKSPVAGQVRIIAILDDLPDDIEIIQIQNSGAFGNPIRTMGFKITDKFTWRWDYDEAEEREIAVIDNGDGTKKINIIMGPFNVEADEWLYIYPDTTYGPTEATSDGFETVGGSWFDNYSGVIFVGSYGGAAFNAGLHWSSISVPAGATATNGCKITVNSTGTTGSGVQDATIELVDSRSPAVWGDTNRPVDGVFHSDAVAWDGSDGDSSELSTLFNHRFNGDEVAAAHQENDPWAIAILENSPSGYDYVGLVAVESGDGTELTIVYTPAGGGGSIMNQLQGPNLGSDLFNGVIQ